MPTGAPFVEELVVVAEPDVAVRAVANTIAASPVGTHRLIVIPRHFIIYAAGTLLKTAIPAALPLRMVSSQHPVEETSIPDGNDVPGYPSRAEGKV